MPEGGLLKLSETSYEIHGHFMRPLRLLVTTKNIFRRFRLGRGHRFPHEKWVHTFKLRWGHLSLWSLEKQVSLGRKKSDLQMRPRAQINPIPETSRALLGDPCCVGTCMGSVARAAVMQQWLTNRKSFSYSSRVRVRNQVAGFLWRLSLPLTASSGCKSPWVVAAQVSSPPYWPHLLAGPLLYVNLTLPHSDETLAIGRGLSITPDGYIARSLTQLSLQRSLSEEGTLPGLESGPEWTFISEQVRQRSVSWDSCQQTY